MGPPTAKKQRFYEYSISRRRGGRVRFIEVGFSGFLATCNFREKDCSREAYNILNEYANEIYGSANETGSAVTVKNEVDTSNVEAKKSYDECDAEDISDKLTKQSQAAQKNTSGKKQLQSRFEVVHTGASNCVFVRTKLPDPSGLGLRIVNDVMRKSEQKTRFLLRLVPIEIVCRADIEDILKTGRELIAKQFKQATTFAIVFNRRYNNVITRDDVIPKLAQFVSETNPNCVVDLKNAYKTIIVEVIKGLCCMGIVTGYMMYKKYNLIELANANNGEGAQEQKSEQSAISCNNVPDIKPTIEPIKGAEPPQAHLNDETICKVNQQPENKDEITVDAFGKFDESKDFNENVASDIKDFGKNEVTAKSTDGEPKVAESGDTESNDVWESDVEYINAKHIAADMEEKKFHLPKNNNADEFDDASDKIEISNIIEEDSDEDK